LAHTCPIRRKVMAYASDDLLRRDDLQQLLDVVP
jgi:hypothetical protein